MACARYTAAAKYLLAFLARLAAQQYANWALWAVDDQSTDESAAMLMTAAAADMRIHVHPTPDVRLGAAGAFARLWMRVPAHAQTMALADQDDVWHPAKLSDCVTALCRT
jgi:glycosyltransferase involved in cell wall biosynthesis